MNRIKRIWKKSDLPTKASLVVLGLLILLALYGIVTNPIALLTFGGFVVGVFVFVSLINAIITIVENWN